MKDIIVGFIGAAPPIMLMCALVMANLDLQRHRILIGGIGGIWAVMTFSIVWGAIIFGVG